ncbi:MAG TPA: hypothetical protein VII75_03990 [Thermoanaerobaculia bacterium]
MAIGAVVILSVVVAWLIAYLLPRSRKKGVMPFTFSNNEKFSFIAVNHCFSYVKAEAQLSDGTWVLPKLPTGIDKVWASWIGTIRLERLTSANLILLRRVSSSKPEILDDEHKELFQEVMTLFWLLQLSGVVQYGGASAVQGSFHGGDVNIRQMVQLEDYYPTEGSPRYPVTIERLEEAGQMSAVWRELRKKNTHARFRRGARILRDGLEMRVGQDRQREFTRSIEALIRPDPYKTTKQFKTRAQTLGVRNKKSEEILYESYEMRCDVEHVHEWDRFLQKYPEDERLAIANMRTRQMEALARESYRRILLNAKIRAHFESDDTLNDFWVLPFGEQRKIWGPGIDVTGFRTPTNSRRRSGRSSNVMRETCLESEASGVIADRSAVADATLATQWRRRLRLLLRQCLPLPDGEVLRDRLLVQRLQSSCRRGKRE